RTMVQINFAKREVQCKVVYYGPSMAGKTANLRQIHERSPERVRGQLTTIATDTNRTLFFDFLPLNLGLVGNVRAKINLYAVPYQDAQNALRLLVLEGVDGVVFVADSTPNRIRANMKALENLHENMSQLGRDLRDVPLVFQWNKRDLKEAVSVAELAQALNPHGQPAFEAAALMGAGVFQTLKAITHAVLVNVTKMIVATPEEPAMAAVGAAEEPLPAQAPEPVAAAAPARIRAVASRERTRGSSPRLEPVTAPAAASAPSLEAEPEFPEAPAFERGAAAGSRLDFDDVSLPQADAGAGAPAQEDPPEQGAHETPITPPWRRSPSVRSQQEEFADHLSTDSFSHVGPSAHATTELPSKDVPRAADRSGSGRPTRGRSTDTETSLVDAASAHASNDWAEYTDPKSVDLQGAAAGWGGQPATGSVRVRGAVSTWDDARRRDPRPVVDRRKRPRRENVEVLSTRSLWAGSLFSLFLLGIIGYLVHALL
ncbi:MAG TPA: ADP-ribosylation factor-like protein, partial [Planctomycetota bacterium]|nr:ADP-ribosylation factor-like protein [Planctomycetota bacterium]